jgi:hypothetical protein
MITFQVRGSDFDEFDRFARLDVDTLVIDHNIGSGFAHKASTFDEMDEEFVTLPAFEENGFVSHSLTPVGVLLSGQTGTGKSLANCLDDKFVHIFLTGFQYQQAIIRFVGMMQDVEHAAFVALVHAHILEFRTIH